MEIVSTFLCRGYEIKIAYVETYFTFGWNDKNKAVLSKYQHGGLDEAISEARLAVDAYANLMNRVQILERAQEEAEEK